MNTTLRNHIASTITAETERLQAWVAEDPKNRWVGISDADYEIELVEKYNPEIESPEQWDALRAWNEYYDAYKDVNDISPRWTSYKDGDADYWRAELEEL
jgi:hypothetical protein